MNLVARRPAEAEREFLDQRDLTIGSRPDVVARKPHWR